MNYAWTAVIVGTAAFILGNVVGWLGLWLLRKWRARHQPVRFVKRTAPPVQSEGRIVTESAAEEAPRPVRINRGNFSSSTRNSRQQ